MTIYKQMQSFDKEELIFLKSTLTEVQLAYTAAINLCKEHINGVKIDTSFENDTSIHKELKIYEQENQKVLKILEKLEPLIEVIGDET